MEHPFLYAARLFDDYFGNEIRRYVFVKECQAVRSVNVIILLSL